MIAVIIAVGRVAVIAVIVAVGRVAVIGAARSGARLQAHPDGQPGSLRMKWHD